MWVAKLKFWHRNSLVIPYAKKLNLTILSYPLNTYVEKGKLHISSAHLVLGEEKNKHQYFKEIRKNKRLEHVEVEGDVVIYSFSAPAKETHLQVYFRPEIMLIKPVTIKPDGFEYLEAASWDKKHISDFLKECKKWLEVESFSIKRQKITDIYIPHLMPKLTEKQRKAVMLAYESGYYDFPKKTNIEKLSKAMKSSPSTFQEHLRRAEEKLMPFLLENLSIK